LYYGKRDGPRLINLMRKGKRGKSKSLQSELQQFHAVSEYCLNSKQCRHAQLIAYFGERWSQGRCADKCDICRDEVVVGTGASGGAKNDKQPRKTANDDARQKRKRDAEPTLEAQPLPGFRSAARLMEQNMQTSTKSISKASGSKSILSCFNKIPKSKS
jgi:superfamily II DNA helicase RecQ